MRSAMVGSAKAASVKREENNIRNAVPLMGTSLRCESSGAASAGSNASGGAEPDSRSRVFGAVQLCYGCPVGCPGFAQHAVHVVLHGLFRKTEASRDLLVGEAIPNQSYKLLLSGAEIQGSSDA